MGEALVFSIVGMVIALSLCELSLPVARTLLDVPMTFRILAQSQAGAGDRCDHRGHRGVVRLLSGIAALTIESCVDIERRQKSHWTERRLRQALVIFQFAMLAALIVSVIVAGRQVDYLLQEEPALRRRAHVGAHGIVSPGVPG